MYIKEKKYIYICVDKKYIKYFIILYISIPCRSVYIHIYIYRYICINVYYSISWRYEGIKDHGICLLFFFGFLTCQDWFTSQAAYAQGLLNLTKRRSGPPTNPLAVDMLVGLPDGQHGTMNHGMGWSDWLTEWRGHESNVKLFKAQRYANVVPPAIPYIIHL
jgi:hypothetical protein